MNNFTSTLAVILTVAILVIFPSWLFMLVAAGVGVSISFYYSLAFGVLFVYASVLFTAANRSKKL
jgi:hypothetical protein